MIDCIVHINNPLEVALISKKPLFDLIRNLELNHHGCLKEVCPLAINVQINDVLAGYIEPLGKLSDSDRLTFLIDKQVL